MKEEIKKRWKQYLLDHPEWCKKVGNHHYFRSRYYSRFWLDEIIKIIKK